MSIPDYDASGMPTIQGPWINIDNYGVPSKTDKFGKPRLNQGGQQLSDRERGKIKIPLNMNIDESKKLHEFLSSIDKKLEENRDIIFGAFILNLLYYLLFLLFYLNYYYVEY
jgi:hypothetical protein